MICLVLLFGLCSPLTSSLNVLLKLQCVTCKGFGDLFNINCVVILMMLLVITMFKYKQK